MSRHASTFRQNDVTRAIKGAKAAGCKNPRVEIGNGKIIIVAENDGKNFPPIAEDENEWD